MNYEREVKILNLDVGYIRNQLNDIGAKFIGEGIQKIKTYDFLPLSFRFYSLLQEFLKSKKNIQFIKNIIYLAKEMDQLLSEEEKYELITHTKYNSFSEIVRNDNLEILLNSQVVNIVDNIDKRYEKWCRLRQSQKKVELTIKQIIPKENDGTLLETVTELETTVADFNVADNILNSLGYLPTNYQEKYRISYIYDEVKIDIDKWPLLNPYMEIEANSECKIVNVANLLGYSVKDLISTNVVEVYKMNNIDILKFDRLTFDLEKSSEVEENNVSRR